MELYELWAIGCEELDTMAEPTDGTEIPFEDAEIPDFYK